MIDETESSVTKTLEELIEEAYEKDETVQDIVAAKRKELRKLPLNLIKSGIKLAMGDLKLENDKLYVKGRLYVPDYEPLQLHFIKLYGLMWNMSEKEWCVLIYGRSRLAN